MYLFVDALAERLATASTSARSHLTDCWVFVHLMDFISPAVKYPIFGFETFLFL